MRIRPIALLTLTGTLLASAAGAATTLAQRCEAAKDKAMATFTRCRLNGDASFAQRPDELRRTGVYARCADKLADGFASAEAKAAGACLRSGDGAVVEAFLRTCTEQARDWQAGGSDASLALPRRVDSGQTACWAGGSANVPPSPVPCAGTGQDGDVESGAAPAYVDNGDGTVTDGESGLVWEKKSDDGGPHDMDDTYAWVGTCTGDGQGWCTRDADCSVAGGTCAGTTAFEWVDALNAAAFAGHSDWRLPSVRELATLAHYAYGYPDPAVAPEFAANCGPHSRGNPGCDVQSCSCTVGATGFYWTSTTVAFAPENAWTVFFGYGYPFVDVKDARHHVRAVRGGR